MSHQIGMRMGPSRYVAMMMMTRVGGISSRDRWSHFAVHQLVIPTHNVFKFQLHCLEVGGNVYVIMPSRPQYILQVIRMQAATYMSSCDVSKADQEPELCGPRVPCQGKVHPDWTISNGNLANTFGQFNVSAKSIWNLMFPQMLCNQRLERNPHSSQISQKLHHIKTFGTCKRVQVPK